MSSITGKLPFFSEDQLQLVQYLMTNTPMPPSAVYPATPKALDAIILRAMGREPQMRYQSAQEFKQAGQMLGLRK